MRTPLESWFLQASYKLADESAAQVWAEVREHYDSSCEAALARGVSSEEADRLAVEELGDPQAANRQYRKVLLTVADLKWLARCRESEQVQPKYKFGDFWMLPKKIGPLLVPFLFPFLFSGVREQTWALGSLMIFVGTFRPLMPGGARWPIFKVPGVKWAVMLAMCAVLLQAGQNKVCVVLCALAAYVHYRDSSLRRKLPVEQWPKAL